MTILLMIALLVVGIPMLKQIFGIKTRFFTFSIFSLGFLILLPILLILAMIFSFVLKLLPYALFIGLIIFIYRAYKNWTYS